MSWSGKGRNLKCYFLKWKCLNIILADRVLGYQKNQHLQKHVPAKGTKESIQHSPCRTTLRLGWEVNRCKVQNSWCQSEIKEELLEVPQHFRVHGFWACGNLRSTEGFNWAWKRVVSKDLGRLVVYYYQLGHDDLPVLSQLTGQNHTTFGRRKHHFRHVQCP